jgi:serine phosphatase RsbU (regulator of sigma subunit)
VPCTSVGGDFYDVIPRPDGFVAIVGDVCGKGIPAALLASMVQGMFHAQITTGASLLDAVQSVNKFVCSRAPGEKYLTLVALRSTRAADDSVDVELVNGGHVSPLIVRADGTVETVSDGDLPVGLIEAATFHALHVALAKGDRIVLLSDGISEAEDPEGTQFGQADLAHHLAGTGSVADLFETLERFCEGAAAADDQTVMTVERTV